jgi:transposase
MSQWAEIRHLALVEAVAKKEIARRLGVDIKTVRRALSREVPPVHRASPPRGCRLDPWRPQIEAWLRSDPKLTAKRIGRLLLPLAGGVPTRTVRQYVAKVRRELFPKEAFVHRTHPPGETMEVDFGESWAVVGERLHKCKYLVATLPHSNAYFAKAYPVERLECLLDGLAEAFGFFGGVPRRVVLDNTALAVKKVLSGRHREETDAFHAFRGSYPFHADFCAPAKGWEKGSVETGVKYVRNNAFRPMPKVASWVELNAQLRRELCVDLDARTVEAGRTVRQAWEAERGHLRALPKRPASTCRQLARVADKFGHVRVDRAHYSVPIRYAYRPVWVRLFHDRLEIAVEGEVVARHDRVFAEGAKVLDPWHVLPLLERKHRAVGEATALATGVLPPVFVALRQALRGHTRKPDQEWIRVLRLVEGHPRAAVEAAVAEALERGSPRLETVRLLLRRQTAAAAPALRPAPVARADLAALEVSPPVLGAYDTLTGEVG